jgi:hypothetical protein
MHLFLLLIAWLDVNINCNTIRTSQMQSGPHAVVPNELNLPACFALPLPLLPPPPPPPPLLLLLHQAQHPNPRL